MRLLHTADWHLGRRLYGIDRLDETRAVLAEIAGIAERERVDAVLVAGDLLDRRLIEPRVLGACLDALEDLGRVAPVVAVTGNHDDPDFWERLAPYLESRRIWIRGRVRPAHEAVVTVDTAAGPLHVAALPWPDPARMAMEAGMAQTAAHGRYADQVARVVGAYAEELRGRRSSGAVALLGHLMVDRALAGGGEREVTLGITYAVSGAAIPTDLDYVALGHVHRAQQPPGVTSVARFAGSVVALDFSEEADRKSVVIVELDPAAARTTTREVPLEGGRRLARIEGALEALPALADAHPEAWFHCRVRLDAVEPDLVRRVRELVPTALRVEAVATGEATTRATEADALGRDLPSLYGDWHAAIDRPLDARQAQAFAAVLDEAESEE
jgi:DNA repair protein SbcD/Mre11